MNDNEIFWLNGKSFLLMHSYYFAKDAITNYKNYDWDLDADIIDILKKRWFNKTRAITRGDKKIDYIITGHTHCPAITKRNREDKDSCIINPGSPVHYSFFMNKGTYAIGVWTNGTKNDKRDKPRWLFEIKTFAKKSKKSK
jgi:predicted phosphodiesterase